MSLKPNLPLDILKRAPTSRWTSLSQIMNYIAEVTERTLYSLSTSPENNVEEHQRKYMVIVIAGVKRLNHASTHFKQTEFHNYHTNSL
jgi:hypothetical protein